MEKIDARAFNQIGYGLYVVTTNDGVRDNGMICNTVVQVTATPLRLAVTINKETYTHEIIRKTGRLNVNVIDERAEMDLFRCFGFRSGRTADKFAGVPHRSSENGLAVLTQQVNAFFSLEVEQYVDLGSHGMFICRVVEAQVLSDSPTMSYSYYHAHVKPRPAAPAKKRGFVCKICGYVYEGDELPADFICPICKHPASDFEPVVGDRQQAAGIRQ